ncbi:hypothetical protein JTE90_025983 [Oedothorax gibbosus]|uniref:Secreted protein n=1 Tax=Oedothorax gibbosus TaxID=931172 RepID=A0AAV6U865_9ARAC|nr:hypothetical protein JTE90_025983 [Oedothorax gibbosus]
MLESSVMTMTQPQLLVPQVLMALVPQTRAQALPQLMHHKILNCLERCVLFPKPWFLWWARSGGVDSYRANEYFAR